MSRLPNPPSPDNTVYLFVQTFSYLSMSKRASSCDHQVFPRKRVLLEDAFHDDQSCHCPADQRRPVLLGTERVMIPAHDFASHSSGELDHRVVCAGCVRRGQERILSVNHVHSRETTTIPETLRSDRDRPSAPGSEFDMGLSMFFGQEAPSIDLSDEAVNRRAGYYLTGLGTMAADSVSVNMPHRAAGSSSTSESDVHRGYDLTPSMFYNGPMAGQSHSTSGEGRRGPYAALVPLTFSFRCLFRFVSHSVQYLVAG
ncbi:hypothetical protein BV25DRAFT_229904 [Artomyces pyxidatus]|uniref:Uncharacterized protein n=1 Tax=Artomyces pyxidatus TaxID=48021 RepID=A0ACB8SFP4_9AGAM|nr:hypothetical protein BV25DRAFT_229904 [Artomyces pyxidatus]